MFGVHFLFTSFGHTQEINAERALRWRGWHLAHVNLKERLKHSFLKHRFRKWRSSNYSVDILSSQNRIFFLPRLKMTHVHMLL